MPNKKSKKENQMTKARLSQALKILREYQTDKQSLDMQVERSEKQWLPVSDSPAQGTASAWMFNSIAGKHADAMDSIPEPAVLPRESSDTESAKELSLILPVILGNSSFERVWSECWFDKLKYGCGIYGVFWDPDAQRGAGDIRVKRMDILNLFWEKGVQDIQDSENLFYVSYISKSRILSRYPHIKESLDLQNRESAGTTYNEPNDRSDKCAVIDWYYKKRVKGRLAVHYCKSVNGIILYASENDPLYAERGYYDHGLYPFVFDPLYTVRHSPCGRSFIEIMSPCQKQIDLLEGAISENSRMAAMRRYFAREASGINEEEFANWQNPIVHYSGSGNPSESVMPIEVPALAPVYLNMLEYKVNELKETSGNRDFSQGGTSFGVTAASAIEALQEAGSKLSRDMLKGSYRVFEEICLMVIELVRQFYTHPRCFRITEENGVSFRYYDNTSIKAQPQGVLGDRLPVFDISVKAQKQSPYAKAALNEMAKSFFERGFFSPEKRDQALICLEMMDFEGKDRIVRLISRGNAPLCEGEGL